VCIWRLKNPIPMKCFVSVNLHVMLFALQRCLLPAMPPAGKRQAGVSEESYPKSTTLLLNFQRGLLLLP
jgi:hypothetical protein